MKGKTVDTIIGRGIQVFAAICLLVLVGPCGFDVVSGDCSMVAENNEPE